MAIVIYIVRFLQPVLCCSCLPGNLHLYHDIIHCVVDIEKWQIITVRIIWQSLSHIQPTFVSALLSILFSFLYFSLSFKSSNFSRKHSTTNSDFDILSKSMWMIMNLVALFDPQLGEYLGSARVEPFFATRCIFHDNL